MYQPRNNILHWILGGFLVVIIAIFSVSAYIFSQAETIITQITIINAFPEIDSVYISDTANGLVDDYPEGVIISPAAGTTATLHINGIVSDQNGADDIVNINEVFYRSGIAEGFNCLQDNNDCYRVEPCVLSNNDSTSKKYNCEVTLECYVDTTSDDGQFPTEHWAVYAQVTDGNNAANTNNFVIKEISPYPESCNGADDNCDGFIDENLGTTACGEGVCQATVNNCENGVPQTCEPGDPTETPETTCNDGVDNDCDGLVDNNDSDCLIVDSDNDGVLDNVDACPNTPGVASVTEYVLEIQDFQSTSALATASRVFLGNTEIFQEADGKYHAPLKDSEENYITDNTNFDNIPKGVWVIDRKGQGELLSGLKGQGTGSGTYVYYKALATLDGGFNVKTYKKNPFEKPYDESAEVGNPGNDELTISIDSILAETTVRSKSDYYTVEYADLQGCPVGDITVMKMRIIDQQRSGICGYSPSGNPKVTCTIPLPDLTVKIFDREDENFISVYGSSNPNKSLYSDIYEADIALIGNCVTDANGECLALESYPGKFLVIGKLYDADNDVSVYQGRKKNFKKKVIKMFEEEEDDGDLSDITLKERIIKKNLRIIKRIDKHGNVTYSPGSRIIVIGSVLDVDMAEFIIWDENKELYPFIFTSDEDWDINACMYVPEGYEIVGILDVDGKIIKTDNCIQLIIANEETVILFKVIDIASPEPILNFSIKARHKNGEELEVIVETEIQGLKQETEKQIKEEVAPKIEEFKIKEQKKLEAVEKAKKAEEAAKKQQAKFEKEIVKEDATQKSFILEAWTYWKNIFCKWFGLFCSN